MANDVPEAVNEIIENLGIYVPAEAGPDLQETYEKMLSGHCATCGAEVGKHAWIMVGQPVGLDKPVVVMLFCGGACATDMQVVGWLQQQHEDIVQQIKFRGGEGGN